MNRLFAKLIRTFSPLILVTLMLLTAFATGRCDTPWLPGPKLPPPTVLYVTDDGTIYYSDGSILYPNGVYVYPDGTWIIVTP